MSNDNKILYNVIKRIIETLKSLQIPFKGPIPLPTDTSLQVVRKSPFVYKESNEIFAFCVHKRLIEILDASSKVVDSLSKIAIPCGVSVLLKIDTKDVVNKQKDIVSKNKNVN